jgi:hypothetical protein
MARIRDLPVGKAVRCTLRRERIHRSEDLWRAVGPEFASGLAGLGEKTQLDLNSLLAVLGAGTIETPRRWPSAKEAMVGLICLAIATLAAVRLGEAFAVIRFPAQAMSADMDQVVVTHQGGLPAFHVLEPSDLGLVRRHRVVGGVKGVAEVLGHYLIRPVAAGNILHHDEVSSFRLAPRDLGDQWIVTVSVASSAVGPQTVPGSEVSMILSPKQGSARPSVEVRALVLAIERGATVTMATLALGQERRAEVAGALGSAVVLLALVPRVHGQM